VNGSPDLCVFPEEKLKGARIFPAKPVNLRRDLYHFVVFVQTSGVTRSHRGNSIPKTAARKLAKLLSYNKEAQTVEERGAGFWSDKISYIAKDLGLVNFETEGVYAGYSSQSASYPENHIKVDDKAWKHYLNKGPREKERVIVNTLLQLAPNEFFHSGMLILRHAFDTWGSRTGPVSRMKLPSIRRSLLKMLASLSPDIWYDTHSFVEFLRFEHPHLIMDPATCEPDSDSRDRLRTWEYDVRNSKRKREKEPPRPEVALESIYANFCEFDRKGYDEYSTRKSKKYAPGKPDSFHRVEGRYIEWFLSETAYIAGFVTPAFRSDEDAHGKETVPEYERLLAFKLTPWFFAVMKEDSQIERVNVTVLPNFEIIVDALSYPEATLADLERYAVLVSEDGPVRKLRLDRNKVVEAAALGATPAPEALLRITGKPVPENVAAELESWCGRGKKLVFFENNVSLLELHGDAEKPVIDELQKYLVDRGEGGFAFIRNSDKAFKLLEEKLHVPMLVKHPETTFAAAGVFAHSAPEAVSAGKASPKKPIEKVRLQSEDLVGCRSPHRPLLEALYEELREKAETCLLPEAGDLLVISASALPKLRAVLRGLSDRYEVEWEARPASGKK
jgi:hypothetical protein